MSRLTVLENMGGPRENSYGGLVRDWAFPKGSGLNTLAIECFPDKKPEMLSRIAGLPDSVFRHDGKITKQEVRSVTLARLMPFPEHRLWDVGAGCGSVAIEWMRSHPRCQAIAIEHENSKILGTPLLEIIEGEAPIALSQLKKPDAVFVGGGLTSKDLLESCWDALRPLGRLVANAVTLEGEQKLLEWNKTHAGELTRVNISRAESVGSFQGWRSMMPVTQFSVIKQ